MNDLEKLIDESKLIDNSSLVQLNKAIDITIIEKQKVNIDYNMLENVLEKILGNRRIRKTGPIKKIIPIKKSDILAVALNFFESIDKELYSEVVKVIFNQRDRTKMRIYNVHKIQDFAEKEDGIVSKYTKHGIVQTAYGNSYINIPLQENFSREEGKVLGEDEGDLDDLYTIVHEIAHLFDLNPIDTSVTYEEILQPERGNTKKNIAREILAETTTIAFEGLLTEYLLKNKIYPEAAIRERANKRENLSFKYAQEAYSKLVLAKEKEKTGEITSVFIKNMMEQCGMSVEGLNYLLEIIMKEKKGALYNAKYAIGSLVSPTIIKAYEDDKIDGVRRLKMYLKAVHDGDLVLALNAFDIELNDNGLNVLIRNRKLRDEKVNEQRER